MDSKAAPLTREQLDVLENPTPNLVVSAAAGAGKTRVLVESYFQHVVQNGLSPDQILTITFTKKAAAEMKQRIVMRLRNAGRMAEAQIAETGPIQTIHSFCERLLRENSIEAGLDPEFGILGEGESARITDRAVKQALVDVQSPYAEDLIRRLAGKRGTDRGAALGLLEGAVQRMLDGARGGGMIRADLLDTYDDPVTVLQSWRSEVLKNIPPDVVIDPTNSNFAAAIATAYRTAKRPVPAYARSRAEQTDELVVASQTCGLVALACEAWRLIDIEIEKRQELDFVSLEARACRLLVENGRVRSRICSTYKVVMVDEGQDVNPTQNRLLGCLNVNSKLMVGDQRQSIYGWRQADVKLFVDQASANTSVDLNENHRSQPGIVNFVNTVFGRVWDEHKPMRSSKAPVSGFNGVEIWQQQVEDTYEVSRMIAEMIAEGEKPGDIAVLVRASKYAATIYGSLAKHGVKAQIIGGSQKFYVRMEIRDLANAMRALVDPSNDFSLLATLRSPFASLSLDAITLLALRPPVSEALADFESPVAGDNEALDKFREWFLPLRKYADRLPAWEVIAEIFARSGFLEALALRHGGTQQIANVRKLLWMATEQPELGAAEFAEQVREIQELNHQEGDAPVVDDDANVVKIMTIHKSKGLEFPVVVVPNLHRPLDGRRETVEVEPRIPMVVTGFENMNTPYLSFLAQGRYEREKAEEERLLYVAMTRAERRLCVVAHPNTRKDSLAKLIAKNTDLFKAEELGLVVKDLTPQ